MAANGNGSGVRNGNGNGIGAGGSITHIVLSHSASELESVLRMIREERRTGSLTINFSQGSPSGHLEWRERASSSSLGPIRSLISDTPHKI